jgi:hypothetical protein
MITSIIPAPYRLLAGIAAIAAITSAVWLNGSRHGLAKGRAETAVVQQRWDAERAAQTAAALAASEQARAEEQRRANAQQEIQDAHDKALAQARGDALLADAAAGRLRARIAVLIAAARGAEARDDSPSSHIGTPADDAGSMLADVFGRCVERVRFLATVADERGAAGQSCERWADALTR